jgi:uncharacterized protein YjlB
LGERRGEQVNVEAGDIPAGVGHKCIDHSNNLTVVGTYPTGLSPDLMKGEKEERPETDKNITSVSLPATNPLLGKDSGLREIWNN